MCVGWPVENSRPKTNDCGCRNARIYRLYSLQPHRRTASTTLRLPVRAAAVYGHFATLATNLRLIWV